MDFQELHLSPFGQSLLKQATTLMWSSGQVRLRTASSTKLPSPPPMAAISASSSSSSRKTMEEVWRDINLTTLLDISTKDTDPNTTFTGFFQDFLSGHSSSKEPPPTTANPDGGFSLFPSTPPMPLPTNSPSLNSSLQHPNNSQRQCNNVDVCVRTGSRSNAQPGSSSVPSSLCKKRVTESGENLDDRYHKRMIKNREAAARSRAKKQAYTDELELKLGNLMEENARLRKELQQRYLVAFSAQLPQKKSLHRASTAPF